MQTQGGIESPPRARHQENTRQQRPWSIRQSALFEEPHKPGLVDDRIRRIDHPEIQPNHSPGVRLEMVLDLLEREIAESIRCVGIGAFVVVRDDGELGGLVGVA